MCERECVGGRGREIITNKQLDREMSILDALVPRVIDYLDIAG